LLPNRPLGGATASKVSPVKTPSAPLKLHIFVKNPQKVVENERIGERSSNPVFIFIFNDFGENGFIKTDFSKIFQNFKSSKLCNSRNKKDFQNKTEI